MTCLEKKTGRRVRTKDRRTGILGEYGKFSDSHERAERPERFFGESITAYNKL